MQDKKDGDDFEDLDFEDLDGDDDFDESWDDFDDVDDAGDDLAVEASVKTTDNAAPDAAAVTEPAGKKQKTAKKQKAPAAPKAPKDKKKKSSLVNMAIIGVAVLGGGGFIVSQLSTPPAGQNTEIADLGALPEPDDIPELSGDMPPMPSPMDARNDSDAFDLSLDDTPAADAEMADIPGLEDSADDVLTPLPGLSETPELSDLADLDLALEDSLPEANTADTAKSSGLEDLGLMDEPATLQEDASAVLNIGPDIEENAALPPLYAETEIIAEPVPSLDLEETPAPEPVIEADTSGLENEIDTLNVSLAEKDTALGKAAAEKNALSEQLNKATNQVSDLQAQLSKLQAEIKALKNQPAPAAAALTKTAPDPAPVAVKSLPKAQAEPSPAPAPVKAVEWVLRAAQPGMATLSAKDNGDMRQIEVGDTVAGLGKIQSIAVESGKWVVRGSQGQVSQ